jgi:hypothetical protein
MSCMVDNLEVDELIYLADELVDPLEGVGSEDTLEVQELVDLLW